MNDKVWALQVHNVNKSFGDKKVLFDVNFNVKPGQIVSVIGPSGCGKTTLLSSILGTHPPTSGYVFADEKPIIGPTRNVGIVYQNYALYDFLTAKRNVAFGPTMDTTTLLFRMFRPFSWRKIRSQFHKRAEEYLSKVGLQDCFDSYPSELSGGMKQRVAIAQSLIMQPAVLLMDEPFGALDEATRERLQLILLNLYQENIQAKKEGRRPPHTILIVTHELNEALYVSDRVIGLSQYHEKGKLGATVVYDQPTPVFRPNDPKDFSRFAKIKDQIRDVVFSAEHAEFNDKLIAMWDMNSDQLPGTALHDPNFSLERV